MKKPYGRYFFLLLLTVCAAIISLPKNLQLKIPFLLPERTIQLGSPNLSFSFLGRPVQLDFSFKQGLDIQGGMQIVLEAEMSAIPAEDRTTALESVRQVILRRVDLYGIAEPVVQTAANADTYRLIVELPGVTNSDEALQLVGQTAQLDFELLNKPEALAATTSAAPYTLISTGLSGKQLKRATVQFDQKTGKPEVGIEFNEEGTQLFGQITEEHTGELLAIMLDGSIIMAPQINEPIYGGAAVINGLSGIDEAKQLSIQLNAGALPVPITVLEQRSIGPTLGTESVRQSIFAGLVGLVMVMLFMILYYGQAGLLASVALGIYAVLTIALYKLIGVTVTLPGIAGLLLSIGMAVDANILIFERMKEEIRLGKPFTTARELGFGRAWNSIKDANFTTIMTALVLINPLSFSFLNTSGLVRGFGITLLIGVLLGLFTGVVLTRTLVRLFLSDQWFRPKE
ncbi:MAG: protein translocase subunit SecD [Candidatus Pacebacteria bacterium CG_4_10_14_0_8_um_filter_43_12]|nr:MAG: protein translocase subunit SecD [Candidatus Pacebacteria bacterium CG_4_10_14_0_8_um_filter_43_12]